MIGKDNEFDESSLTFENYNYIPKDDKSLLENVNLDVFKDI